LRRWFGEVIIIFYQMPVLVEARGFGSASTQCSRTVADVFPAASENVKVRDDSRVLLICERL
jgi:hypothetical protein